MRSYYVLLRSEWVEAVRELKFVWMTIVFVMLGLTQPLINKYMDVILKNVDGASGIMLDPNREVPGSSEIFISTMTGQFNQLGLIILIISIMGMILSDRKSGMQDFILTRPVSVGSYVMAKLTGNWLVSMVSLTLGIAVSYYYTVYLFGYFLFVGVLGFLVVYGIWIIYVISLVMVLSSFLKNQLLVAVVGIVLSMGLVMLSGLSGDILWVSPGAVLTLANSFVIHNAEASYLSIVSCVSWIVLNVSVLNWRMRK